MSDLFKFPGRDRTTTTRDLGTMREFDTGATRNADSHKPDPDGFISPLVVERYCQYMHAHRVQADGTLRASDNWTKGIPLDAYRKSLNRHHLHAWLLGRGYEAVDYDTGKSVDIEEALCAIIFNASGWLHELRVDKTREHSVHSNHEFDADREGWQ